MDNFIQVIGYWFDNLANDKDKEQLYARLKITPPGVLPPTKPIKLPTGTLLAPEIVDELQNLWISGMKLAAVKLLKEESGMNIKDSKDFLEKIFVDIVVVPTSAVVDEDLREYIDPPGDDANVVTLDEWLKMSKEDKENISASYWVKNGLESDDKTNTDVLDATHVAIY
jgi:hypothetical protein